MGDRFTPSGWWLPIFTAALGLVAGGVLMAGFMYSPQCQDALAAADARYALSESTTALVYDQWRADNLGDAHGVEYAKSGIQTNQDEIDALTTDYNELKEACK